VEVNVRIRLQGGPFDGQRHAMRKPGQPPAKIWVERCEEGCTHVFAQQTRHGEQYRREVIAALGAASGVKPKVTQGGILWLPSAQADALFVDLRKAERDYSPSTMYRDYAINRTLFHWESQVRQTPEQRTVERYINHQAEGTQVLLFRAGEQALRPWQTTVLLLGPVRYVEHRGERPVSFTWRLPRAMPEELFEVARSVAAA
jgi:hypothetical protein